MMRQDSERFFQLRVVVRFWIKSELLLIVVRHGRAEPKSSKIQDDERRLSAVGEADLRQNLAIAKGLAGRRADLVLSSPLVRAQESARIAMEIFETSRLEIEKSLLSDSEPYEVFKVLSVYRELACVVLVSHQPLVSRLLSSLLNWDDGYFSFETGAVAIVEVNEIRENATGVLRSFIQNVR